MLSNDVNIAVDKSLNSVHIDLAFGEGGGGVESCAAESRRRPYGAALTTSK